MKISFRTNSVCSLTKLKFTTLFNFLLLSVTLSISVFAIQHKSQAASFVLDTNFNAGVIKGDALITVTKPLADKKILVGGSFTIVNEMPNSYLVRLNSDGSTDSSFNSGSAGPNGTIYDIVSLADGKFLISGAFTAYNGVARAGIVRINADGSLDSAFNSVGTGAGGTAQTIAVQSDGKILISGRLSSYNGIQKFSVIRLNDDGSLDNSFASPFTSAQFVEEIDVQSDGKILISGAFTLSGRSNIARLNTNGSLDSTFIPLEGSTAVYAVTILSDGKILIGGDLSSSGNSGVSPTRRLNSDGSTDNTFSTGAAIVVNQTEYFAVQNDGKILTAGAFSNDGVSTLALLRLNADGSFDNLFSVPKGNDRSYHVTLQSDGKILLSGEFSVINGQSKPGIVRLNSDGTIDSSFNTSFYNNGLVYSITQQTDGKVLVGGDFNYANGNSRANLARFNTDGSLDNSFASGTGLIKDYVSGSKILFDIEIQSDGKILLAGIFNGYNGIPRRSIVRLNTDGTVDKSFEAQYFINSAVSWVYDALILPDGKILAAIFTTNPSTGGTSSGIIRLNPDGSLDSSLSVTADLTIRKIVRQQDGKIVIGGTFLNVNGYPTNRIARLNPDGAVDFNFNIGSGFNGTVLDIIVQPDGKILASGAFTAFNGTTRNRIARLNPNGSLDTTFNPGSGANTTVWRLSLEQAGKIILGGNFSTINGVNRNRLARLNPDGSLDTDFESGLSNNPANSIRALFVQSDGRLVLGGSFDNYNGVSRNSIARLSPVQSASAPYDFDGDGKSDISVFRPSASTWYLLQSQSGFSGVRFGVSTDKLVPADFDGDGKTDIAVFRDGNWYRLNSSNSEFNAVQFGANDDLPRPGDFDGDGKADIAVFRPSNGTWYWLNSSNGKFNAVEFGSPTDIPLIADFDGDGKSDIAVFRPSDGAWYYLRSSSGQFVAYNFGTSNDLPLTGDFDGDGKTDFAVFRPQDGTWYFQQSASGFSGTAFGINTDIPTVGDYDGDGKSDIGVYRPSDGAWYLLQSQSGFNAVRFGASEDKPIPSVYLPR